MTSFQPPLLRLSMVQIPKPQTISRHLCNYLATTTHSVDAQLNFQPTAHPPSPDPIQDTAQTIASHLSKCANLIELNQLLAHIIRTHFLELYPAPFQWNNIIRSYSRLEAHHYALSIYIAMSRAGVSPDSYTIPIVLKAVCQAFAIGFGRQVHSVAIRHGLELNEYCESGFISVYSKAGEFENAHKVFEQNRFRKLGSWNAIIGGLSQGGRAKEAVTMFMEMRKCGFEPDEVTMVSVTSACGSLGHLDLALQLHKCVYQAKTSERSDTLTLNSLVDMYGKCGRMDLAYRVFSRMDEPNVSSWTSMIVGYAMHGQLYDALECFRCMREAGVRPNHVTFIGVLSACVHGGAVQEGKYYFDMMTTAYGLVPRMQHYGCMVDLLGRAGLLEEAREMVERMPMKANVIVWGCLMGACEKYGNVKMGEWVAEHLLELEPWNDGVFVVLSNIYASRGLWREVERVRGVMKERKLDKVPAYSLATNAD
ncbi:hypothetical protein PVL29_014164 [Vitis rotundifolia]|uniref:Pentatricopeptide repeat-containing protein n=1 Tax=Vitis rotundifolia TaxID=103349 RepID=A0AA39DL10_VITRO|nr:hypothetical protein PVL29_014164 [Vitis rotundifolia]